MNFILLLVFIQLFGNCREIKSLFFWYWKRDHGYPRQSKDEVQKDARNEPDPFIKKFWQPKTSVKEGLKKVFEEMKKDYDKYDEEPLIKRGS